MSNLGNCGDFLPGYEPRVSVTSNTLPPVYVPNPNSEVSIFNVPDCPPPSEPGSPSEPGVPGVGSPGGGGGSTPPGPAGPQPPAPPAPTPPGPTTGGPPPGPSAPPPGGPRFRPRDVITGGPAGPSAPAPTGPAGRGNPRRAPRRRTPTTGGPAGPSAPIPGGFVPGGTPTGTGTTTDPPNVTAPKLTNPLLRDEPSPGSVVIGNSTREQSAWSTNTLNNTTNNTYNSNLQNSEGVTNANSLLNQLENSLPQREVLLVNVDNPIYTTYTSSSTQLCNSLFNKVYNFFNVSPQQESSFVQNTQSSFSIFSNLVSEEVLYFLERQDEVRTWDETMVNNLTIQKVAASLNTNILNYFNNIHDAGNSQVNRNKFYSTVKRHLLEGTIKEFNSAFFQSVYEKQIQDPFITYNQTGENNTTVNLAFAIFEQNGINPNYSQPGLSKNQINDFLRMRFLPEDLECYIPIVEIDGTLSQLYVKNSGIPTQQVGVGFVPNPASGVPLPFGQGAGYYFSTLAYGTSAIYPIPTQNLLSAAYYVGNRDRQNILNLLNADSSFYLTAKSASGIHEFSSTYNPSADVNVMYFALSADTVGDVLNTNSVITTTSAIYYLMTDLDAINHSMNYGLNTVKVNVDFRDPILNYAKDTSNINFKCNDFNLRSLGRTTTLATNKVMIRNIPQALIFAPGCGSRHNPFNSTSELDIYENNVVTRTLKINASINNSNREIDSPPLEQQRIYFGLNSSHLGAYEQQFNDDIHGFIYSYNPTSVAFQNSYYINSEYSNAQPASSLRENSPEAKFMNLVDRLTSVAKIVDEDFTASGLPDLFGFVTWYDIYRRLTPYDVGQLKYSKINQFLNKLPDGYSNGVPVKPVLNENNALVTGIPEFYESYISPPAPIIVSEQDRLNHFVRYFN